MTSSIETILDQQLHLCGFAPFEREYRFDATRKWRFDFAWPLRRVAVEVEGGVWANGRHTRGKGFIMDCEKYNRAALLGWRVLRYTKEAIQSGAAIRQIEEALAQPAKLYAESNSGDDLPFGEM